jgi:hypothetical protein
VQEWLKQNSPDISRKMKGHPIRPILTLLTFISGGAMLEKYQAYTPKPTNKTELKIVLEAIWNDLSQEPTKKAALAFRKRLQACIRADGGHFEHRLP